MSELALLKYGLLFFTGVGSAAIGWSFLVHRRLTKAARFFAVVFAGLFSLGVYAFQIEPNWIEVHRLKIHDRELARILGNTRIVHITDIHMTEGIGFREKQMIRKVNALHPDLIFFTGDVIDDLTQLKPAFELFRHLDARMGIFGVPGDTDLIVMNAHSFARELQAGGVDILNNETRPIKLPNGHILWLIGINDANESGASVKRALQGVPEGVPTIVIAPGPEVFETVSEMGNNLLLVGDTHGGQVGIPFLIQLSEYANRTPYMRGLFKKGKTKMYVNRGIGMKTIPIRFLCRPEITMIEIKP